ncbi:MAG: hypothetical protein A2Z91_02280 [Deltaproteobacteria bacterium GWA2_38_16]|nr:MAG: hypothetical protein A2Z91_02280 [Deltaproteobacteria bacterium GWA2_38_16]OGQ02023.1 MAG: hypothetical protein A3D19_08575 [Deltaproteobacteria bacterium RIFCSPHIGHO2_02_FULL_38_15]OGQ30889.1 MAG: hypothetical protein A3A72_02070 [Deltaproteobacteria bacterium RIFCSPLOWO2_01_FULL_38_9]OGQ61073.1 MAG: hypothetical protein A3G92_02045 [Deltaproteobacteria bacterium RIFCSPLOWO2_12_FULL_38_8]HBQ21557.1 hypothetical protein [Deltaproteobacteria bacterium]
MKKILIRSINKDKLAILFAALSGVYGIIIAGVGLINGILTLVKHNYEGIVPSLIAVGFGLIIYPVLGYISGLVTASIFNYIGGIDFEINIEDKK